MTESRLFYGRKILLLVWNLSLATIILTVMIISRTNVIQEGQRLTRTKWNYFNIGLNPSRAVQNKSTVRSPSMTLIYPRAPDPDRWQVAVPEKTYVYSAHLDPWSRNETVIHVLGSTTKDELMNPNRTKLYCKIWVINGTSLRVLTSEVTDVMDIAKEWKPFE